MKPSQHPRGEASLRCTADTAVLAQSLPLAPHSRVVVPVTVHCPKVLPVWGSGFRFEP